MIKEYRKISTIKAEQFDGSKEQIQKYAIDAVDLMDLYGAQGEGSAMRYTLPTKKRADGMSYW
uniref:hypothetical protein n=1 Tax=Lentilactobacillus hilgardii TaxID=1588 RepID=UPI00403F553C